MFYFYLGYNIELVVLEEDGMFCLFSNVLVDIDDDVGVYVVIPLILLLLLLTLVLTLVLTLLLNSPTFATFTLFPPYLLLLPLLLPLFLFPLL